MCAPDSNYIDKLHQCNLLSVLDLLVQVQDAYILSLATSALLHLQLPANRKCCRVRCHHRISLHLHAVTRAAQTSSKSTKQSV
jgi:hypothetical protein